MQPCLWMCTTSINFQQPSIACLWPPNESAWGNQSCWHCIWMRYDSSSMYILYIYIIINLYRNNIYIYISTYIYIYIWQISINAMWDTVAQKCKTQKPFRTNVYKSSTTPYCKQQSLYLLRICCTRSSGQPCLKANVRKSLWSYHSFCLSWASSVSTALASETGKGGYQISKQEKKSNAFLFFFCVF